ncbi:hypothetical protein ES703_74009 [subsurface metagenome]
MVRNQVEQKEIGRIPLGEGENLVVNLVDDEKLDFRIWMDTERYKGPTKRGVRFYIFDGNWDEFKKLMETVDREVEKVA